MIVRQSQSLLLGTSHGLLLPGTQASAEVSELWDRLDQATIVTRAKDQSCGECRSLSEARRAQEIFKTVFFVP
jgi:hypothetical protein